MSKTSKLLSAISALSIGFVLLASPAFADSTVGNLPAVTTPLTGTELLYCVQGDADRKCTTSLFASASNNPNVINDYGAVGDGQIIPVTATIGTGGYDASTLHVSSPTFAASDVGKVFGLTLAGATQTYGSVTSIPLSVNGSQCTGTPPNISVSTPSTGAWASYSSLFTVNSATVASGGTGMTPATSYSFTILTASGTSAVLTGTTNGSGVLAGAITVTTPGSFILKKFTLSAVPSISYTGAGTAPVTYPTFNLTADINATQANVTGRLYPTAGVTATYASGTCVTPPVAGTPVVTAAVAQLAGTITAYIDSQTVTLSAPASNALSAQVAQLTYGHADSAAFQACGATQNCFIPPLPNGYSYIVGNVLSGDAYAWRGHGQIGYANDVAGNAGAFQQLAQANPRIIADPNAAQVFNVYNHQDPVIEGVFIDCVDQSRDGVSAGSRRLRMTLVTIVRCSRGVGSTVSLGDIYTHGPRLIENTLANNLIGESNFVDGNTIGGSLAVNYDGANFQIGADAHTFSSVRFEWNLAYGFLCYQCNVVTIGQGLFDRNYGCGIFINGGSFIVTTGTQFSRNNKNNDGVFARNGHWCLDGAADAVSIIAPTILHGDDNADSYANVSLPNKNPDTPQYAGAYQTGGSAPTRLIVSDVSGGANGFTVGVQNGAPAGAKLTGSGFSAWLPGPYSGSTTSAIPACGGQQQGQALVSDAVSGSVGVAYVSGGSHKAVVACYGSGSWIISTILS